MGTNIEIRSRSFDGTLRKSWVAEILEQDGGLLLLRGIFEARIAHPLLGVIEEGTISYEYYWLDRWYNVFRFHHPDGRFRNYYCNINMAPRFDGRVLDYVDLDIDVIVDNKGNYRVVDEEEYSLNENRHGYPEDLRVKVIQTVTDLKSMIAKAEFPFDFTEQMMS